MYKNKKYVEKDKKKKNVTKVVCKYDWFRLKKKSAKKTTYNVFVRIFFYLFVLYVRIFF